MKRFAAHYLLLPDVGFIRQQVVEITDEGYVRDVFPLTEEIESVEWMPGLIALLPENKIKNTEMFLKRLFADAVRASLKHGKVCPETIGRLN